MKYGIIGSGAIGGYYGAMLAQNGCDVNFLFHSDYQFVKKNGLIIRSCNGNFHLSKVNAFCDTNDMPKCDIILVCLKSVNQNILYKILPPILKENSLVILIQNGIGLESDLQQHFANLQIAAGLAFICSAKTEPGTINHQCYGSINIGNYSCKDTNLLNQLLQDLKNANIQAAEIEYAEARWKKAVWNMPFNGMTVALNTFTDKLLQNPATEKLIYDQMIEVIDAANHLGIKNITHSFADKMIEMTRKMSPYEPSMKLDYKFHRPMEIYYLYTRPIEEARKAGFEMKKLSMLEAQLKFIEQEYLQK